MKTGKILGKGESVEPGANIYKWLESRRRGRARNERELPTDGEKTRQLTHLMQTTSRPHSTIRRQTRSEARGTV